MALRHLFDVNVRCGLWPTGLLAGSSSTVRVDFRKSRPLDRQKNASSFQNETDLCQQKRPRGVDRERMIYALVYSNRCQQVCCVARRCRQIHIRLASNNLLSRTYTRVLGWGDIVLFD